MQLEVEAVRLTSCMRWQLRPRETNKLQGN